MAVTQHIDQTEGGDKLITKEQIRAAIEEEVLFPDGHGIFSPSLYETHFPVREWGLVETIESDFTNPKYTIFDHEGRPMDRVEGVWNLRLLDRVSRETGLNFSSTAFGRGTAAYETFDAIKAWAYQED